MDSSWGPAVCARAVPTVPPWSVVWGCGNLREFIPAGSSHPHKVLPPLAPALVPRCPATSCSAGVGTGRCGQGRATPTQDILSVDEGWDVGPAWQMFPLLFHCLEVGR